MGCAVETSKPKRRRKGLSTPRPYGELSEEAKARARDCWREKGWTWDQWDSDQLTEFFKQELDEEWGIDEAELSWSLGYCQGDGVSFTASLNLDKVAAKNETVRGDHASSRASGGRGRVGVFAGVVRVDRRQWRPRRLLHLSRGKRR